MILKFIYAATDPPVNIVVDEVTELQVEYITRREQLIDEGFDPDKVPMVAHATYYTHGELRSSRCVPHHLFLMNDSGKTIDRF